MDQVRSQDGDSSGRATQEYCHVGLDLSIGLSEADGVLLMELLAEDTSLPVDDDVDRLSHVIRSLEAEIGGGTATTVTGDGKSWAGPPGEVRGMLDDEMLMDLDGYGGAAAFGYWPEVPPVGDWYVYTEGGEDGSIVGYEVRDQQCYYADQGCVEQAYSPLWE